MTGARFYRRTQLAWPTIVPLALVGGLIAPLFYRNGLIVPMWIVSTTLLVSLVLFGTLTVTVTSDGVEAAFGPGLVRKRLMIGDVVSFMPVRNTWLHGWGIHWFPGGVVWNASGLSAVEFKMANGRLVRIGSAEPDALTAAVGQAFGMSAGAHEVVSTRALMGRHVAGLAIGVLALAFVGWTLYEGFQPPAVVVGDTQFTVSNGLYRNSVSYDTIRTVTIERELPRIGLKTNGFAARNTLRGSFRVDKWGPSRLYVNLDAPPFVVVQSGDLHLAVNFSDPAQTQKLYSDIRTRMGRSTR
jgi:hypothetical protein